MDKLKILGLVAAVGLCAALLVSNVNHQAAAEETEKQPVGTYQLAVGESGIARMDTRTGEVWMYTEGAWAKGLSFSAEPKDKDGRTARILFPQPTDRERARELSQRKVSLNASERLKLQKELHAEIERIVLQERQLRDIQFQKKQLQLKLDQLREEKKLKL